MTTFLITFVVMGVVVLGMSVGLLHGRGIRGTCGGLNRGEGHCGCSAPCERRRQLRRRQ